MRVSTLFAAGTFFTSTLASPIIPRQNSGSAALNVSDARYDGQCFYPEADDDFELKDYLGRWYQVAGTVAPFTAGCKCVYAEYSLNVSPIYHFNHHATSLEARKYETKILTTTIQANGTVNVSNGCEANGQAITIQGTASIVPEYLGYGDEGVFRVQFPGQPAPDCPGPNYIVQGECFPSEAVSTRCHVSE